jgi:hypothetical protein
MPERILVSCFLQPRICSINSHKATLDVYMRSRFPLMYPIAWAPTSARAQHKGCFGVSFKKSIMDEVKGKKQE